MVLQLFKKQLIKLVLGVLELAEYLLKLVERGDHAVFKFLKHLPVDAGSAVCFLFYSQVIV